MEAQIDRIIMSKNPELMGDLHLPMFARVVAVSEQIKTPSMSEQFRPRYAVDIQLLKEDDTPDELFPVMRSVPLPASAAGLERGCFGFPNPGAVVEVAFAYGLPSKPFIRTILTDGLTIPAIEQNELLIQNEPGVFQKADKHGNWLRTAQNEIVDSATTHKLITHFEQVKASTQTVEVAGHSYTSIGGVHYVEAMGALKLLSGGVAHLSALDEIRQVSGKSARLKSGEDYEIRLGKIFDSLAKQKQLIKVEDGGKVWLGSESENVLQLLSELIQVVIDIANTAKNHTHEYTDNGTPLKTKKPDQSGDFAGEGSAAQGIKSRLDPIKE